jgi:hypothetical protein
MESGAVARDRTRAPAPSGDGGGGTHNQPFYALGSEPGETQHFFDLSAPRGHLDSVHFLRRRIVKSFCHITHGYSSQIYQYIRYETLG